MSSKTTLHGVKCEKTKSVCKELRRRGFGWHLADNGSNGFVINTLINGKDFAISMTNSVYCKSFSRGKHKWQKFDDIDQLVLATISKPDSRPSEKQVKYLSHLCSELGESIDDDYPKSVIDAANKISEMKNKLFEKGK